MGGQDENGFIYPSKGSGKGKDSDKGKASDKGKGKGKDKGFYGKDSDKGKGKGKEKGFYGKDSGKDFMDQGLGRLIGAGRGMKGREGPQVYQAVLDKIPAQMRFTCESGPRHAQLIPSEPPQISLAEIFGKREPHSEFDIVVYPRYLKEPRAKCERGHTIMLSRIPWQSSCRECEDPGLA